MSENLSLVDKLHHHLYLKQEGYLQGLEPVATDNLVPESELTERQKSVLDF